MANGKDMYWVGFDLGGTKMMAKVFDEKYNTLAREKKKTKALEGSDAGLERIARTIRQAVESAGIDAGKLAGIGAGVPGPLDIEGGVLLDLPNLGWKNVNLKKFLEKEFKCPVAIINDVDAGTYGEFCFGAGRGKRSILGVFPGTGIGGGFVYDGEIIRGSKHSCLEIGHCQVLPDGPLCGCGKRGCLESVASRLAISSAAAAAAYRGEAPHLAEAAGMDLSNIRSRALAESVAGGDKAVKEIVTIAARWLGIAVANVVNLLAPDIVALGGGMVEAMPEIFLKETGATAHNRVMGSFADIFEVKVAELGDEATAMGSAAWIRRLAKEK